MKLINEKAYNELIENGSVGNDRLCTVTTKADRADEKETIYYVLLDGNEQNVTNKEIYRWLEKENLSPIKNVEIVRYKKEIQEKIIDSEDRRV